MKKYWWVFIVAGVFIVAVFSNYYDGKVYSPDRLVDPVGDEDGEDDCPTGYSKCSKGNQFTCCSIETHQCCGGGGICCPKLVENGGDWVEYGDYTGEKELEIQSLFEGLASQEFSSENKGEDLYCGEVFGNYFCKVTKEMCESKNPREKICKGKGLASKKTICCSQDSTCGFGAHGIPKCVYDECPGGKTKCPPGADSPHQCCAEDETCGRLKPGDDSTYACMDNPDLCRPPNTACRGEGEWSNFQCCKPGQMCQRDISGYARCQGRPR
jgi:hypothetical protein